MILAGFIPEHGRADDSRFVPVMVKKMRPETQRQLRPGLNTKRKELALCL